MDEARKLDLRPLLAVAALVAVVVTMWAAGAFAAGGSSPDSPGSEPTPFIQTEDEQAPPREDCPKDRGGGGGGDGGAPEGDTGGSGAPAL